jgi:hypothetical protein
MPKLKTRKLKLSCSPTTSNPNMEPGWKAHHWRCTLSNTQTKRKMSFVYSKGYGHKGKPPSTTEVLENLKLDAQGIQYSRGFEDWASEYGMDPGWARTKKIYNATKRQTAAYERVVGPVK